MVFSSNCFIFRFLLLFMVVYLLTPKKYRNGVLLLGSLLFYGIGEPHFIWILMGSVAINYVLSLRIVRKKSRVALITTLVFDFLILFLFKYWDFGAENINRLVQQEFLPLHMLPRVLEPRPSSYLLRRI